MGDIEGGAMTMRTADGEVQLVHQSDQVKIRLSMPRKAS